MREREKERKKEKCDLFFELWRYRKEVKRSGKENQNLVFFLLKGSKKKKMMGRKEGS